MKKLVLSLLVVLTFGAYAFYQRMGSDDEAVSAVVPTQSSSLPQLTSDNQPTSSAGSSPTPQPQMMMQKGFKDGQYTGNLTDAYYGNVQVKVSISGGKISDVQFLDYPSDRRTSQVINSQAMPMLKQEAIQAQSAKVDIITGATQTSLAFRQSLQSALQKAQS